MCLGAAKSPKIAGEVAKRQPRLIVSAAGHIKTGEKSRSLPKGSSLTLQRDDVPNVGGVTGGEFLFFRERFVRAEYLCGYFDSRLAILAVDVIDGFL